MLRALDQWRIVAKGLRPHTEPWYQAKVEVVQLQTRLGQPKEAAQLIRYLLATAPDLAGTPLESQLKALLREVDPTP
jgi:hypothetical protein